MDKVVAEAAQSEIRAAAALIFARHGPKTQSVRRLSIPDYEPPEGRGK